MYLNNVDHDNLSGLLLSLLDLPAAAVNKLIKEMLPNMRISNDARELVLNCCTGMKLVYITLVSRACVEYKMLEMLLPHHIAFPDIFVLSR